MNPVQNLPVSGINLPLENFVSLIALVILAIFVIFSSILYYHWQTYSEDIKIRNMTLIFYFTLTIPLVIIMGTMALVIQ